jgi:hypothetical protein
MVESIKAIIGELVNLEWSQAHDKEDYHRKQIKGLKDLGLVSSQFMQPKQHSTKSTMTFT